MQLTILIIESLSNFILIALLVRSELKIIKGKKMLLEQREREQKLEKEFRESPLYQQKIGRVIRKDEEIEKGVKKKVSIIDDIGKIDTKSHVFNAKELQNTLDFLMEYNPKKIEEIGSETNYEDIKNFDEGFFKEKKEKKNKSLETLAMCMGVSVEDVKKIRNLDLLPTDRIKRIIDVYLMKPDIDFAISYSSSDMEVEWARKQVFAERENLKEFGLKKHLEFEKELKSISTDIIRKKDSEL